MCAPQSEQHLSAGFFFLSPNRFQITNNTAHAWRRSQYQHASWCAYQDEPFHPQQWESTFRATFIGLTCARHNQTNSCLQVSCLPTGSRLPILPIRNNSHKLIMCILISRWLFPSPTMSILSLNHYHLCRYLRSKKGNCCQSSCFAKGSSHHRKMASSRSSAMSAGGDDIVIEIWSSKIVWTVKRTRTADRQCNKCSDW